MLGGVVGGVLTVVLVVVILGLVAVLLRRHLPKRKDINGIYVHVATITSIIIM